MQEKLDASYQHLAAMQQEWYDIENIGLIDTPALVVYPERVRDNIRRAILLVGDPSRLRPHMKTSKCAHVCRMMLEEGITDFKCATIAEAELLAMTGAPDVLLAYQPVGPKVDRFFQLVDQYPGTRFSCLVDHPVPAKAIADMAFKLALSIPVYIDLNVGMNRTGITPGDEALDLYETCHRLKGVEPQGFHVYDGHIMHTDLHQRAAACDAAFAPVEAMQDALQNKGLRRPKMIAGGTPTFMIHARYPDRQCSPGTFVYWDASYGGKFPELPFLPAALVVSRVVSVPDANTLTLDLGHKSVAAENDISQRVEFLNAPVAFLLSQSEEHGVVKVPHDGGHSIGSVFYGLPYHVCPTVALYEKAFVVKDRRVVDEWETAARNRYINI